MATAWLFAFHLPLTLFLSLCSPHHEWPPDHNDHIGTVLTLLLKSVLAASYTTAAWVITTHLPFTHSLQPSCHLLNNHMVDASMSRQAGKPIKTVFPHLQTGAGNAQHFFER
jgi:hypothetical protein